MNDMHLIFLVSAGRIIEENFDSFYKINSDPSDIIVSRGSYHSYLF